jgi:c-di-GMP-binding flagellar brake protein YcgR
MTDDASFLIQNPKQIISYLSLLIKNKCLLSARFGSDNESYITTLLGINQKNNTVILDYGSKEQVNRRILNASNIVFETDCKGIKVSFTGAELKKTTYKGEVAFSSPIPKSLFWMERREYFRVKLPHLKPNYCQLMLEDRKLYNLGLCDISLTGFAMLNANAEIAEQLTPGRIFAQGKLILSGAGESEISFEIRYQYVINPDKIQKIQKIGCKIVKLTHSDEDVIQRFMQNIQRENLQKE